MQNNTSLDKVLEGLSQKAANGLTKVFNRYTHSVEEIKLSGVNMLMLALKGETEVGKRAYTGWSGDLPFFAYIAKVGGKKILMLDYRHGFNQELDCDISV